MSNDEQNGEEQETSEETVSEETPKPQVVDPANLYYVHNTTRGRHNRTQRAGQAKHAGLKQYIGGGKYRVIRGRPVALTREQVSLHVEELAQKVAAGIFEVRTHDGRIVDMRTGDAAPRNASAALPRPILDSIANDTQNVGQPMPQYPGGDIEGTPGEEPSLLQDREPEPPPPPAPAAPEPVTEISPELPPPPPPVSEETPAEEQELPDLVGGDVAPEDKPTTPEPNKARSGRSRSR